MSIRNGLKRLISNNAEVKMMQLFEVTLVILAIPSVVRAILPANRRPRWMDGLAAAALLLALINLLAEIWTGRYAFRMAPAYLLILVTGIPAIVRLVRPVPLAGGSWAGWGWFSACCGGVRRWPCHC
jgi:hypothetical protein